MTRGPVALFSAKAFNPSNVRESTLAAVPMTGRPMVVSRKAASCRWSIKFSWGFTLTAARVCV